MRLTYLGHAGFVVEARGVRFLIDPWFFPGFLQSWFPYPDNRFLLPSVLEADFDFLYVSHLHEDHFDHKVLERLNKSVTVLCPNYRSKGVGKKLASMGFRRLLGLSHGQSHRIADGITATMLLDTSHKEDSGLLLDVDGFRFLDLNDCNTSLTELPRDIDLLAAQFSGAMWYPNCYDYTQEVMQEKVDRVRADLMDTLARKCLATEAKAYLPSGGPPCFLDPALAQFNDRHSTIFPLWSDVSADFVKACPGLTVVDIKPGETLNLPSLSVTSCEEAKQPTDLVDYAVRRRNEWDIFYSGDEPQIRVNDIKAYFSRLQHRNGPLSRNLNKYFRLCADDQSWGVQLGKMAEDFVIEGEDPYPPEYMLITSARVLRAILDGCIGWEEALLSMRVKLHRMPDVFDSRFMGLLRYGNEPVQTLQMTTGEGGEMIERQGLRFQRFCPHAGEDLTNAIISGNVIECPRHHWKWDAVSGACIEGGSLDLQTQHCARESDAASCVSAEAPSGSPSQAKTS